MSLTDELGNPASWEKFYEYKTSQTGSRKTAKLLREYIDGECYLDVYESIRCGEPFPLPRKAVISKMSSLKKRTVYIYPQDENITLKRLTHLLLRRYDHLFCPNLYSFRPDKTVKDAVRYLTGIPGIDNMYSYKVDISNYFNSIPVDRLIPDLEEVLSDDPELCSFLTGLLDEPHVLDDGKAVEEAKGIMAGTPQASFYANLYLRDLDRFFFDRGIPYARYSDDILVLGRTYEETLEYSRIIKDHLLSRGLTVNPDKESYSSPEDGWVFLGFSYRRRVIDIAPASVIKIKAKMRRKARALMRWSKRKGESPDRSAAAFIRIFNRKLFDSDPDSDPAGDNELTWSKWYFPVINTDESLKVIDHYAQECVRYLLSGTRGKGRYRVTYDDMKRLGLKSLVHSYYADE